MAAAKRKKSAKRSGWSGRLAGLALCAFFALGVITGLSGSGHRLASRVKGLLHLAARPTVQREGASATPRGTSAAIALVERGDGFYALDGTGGLRGPVEPSGEGDLPILSGATLTNADSARLLDFASVLVRAEAGLGLTISEMRVDDEDGATLYLDRPALALMIDFDHAATEIQRGARVLALWQGHRELLSALDLTVPGQVVARLRPAAFQAVRRPASPRAYRAPARAAVAARRTPEVTASR